MSFSIITYILQRIKHFLFYTHKSQSLNSITIKRSHIVHNFSVFQKHKPGYTIIPVLKSNAYGHGLKQISQIINTIPTCTLVAIDSFPEYQIVHRYTNKQILVMAETFHWNYKLFDYERTHIALRSTGAVKTLGRLGTNIKIHIFVNTGMNREGVQMQYDSGGVVDPTTSASMTDIENLLDTIKLYPNIEIVWLMSHLACADDPLHPLNKIQVDRFVQALQIIKSFGYNPQYIHLEASAGMIYNIDGYGVCNAGRLGLGLYGLDPCYKNWTVSDFAKKLKPALDVYSTVTALQYVHKDEVIWYSATRSFTKPTWVATFGFGYREGFDRAISWRDRKVKIDDQFCSIVWRISMNYASCLLEWLNAIALGTKVHIISSDIRDTNNIYRFYELLQRIPYEIVKLDDKIRKIIID